MKKQLFSFFGFSGLFISALLSLLMQAMPGTVLAAESCTSNQVELWVKASYAISGDTVVIQGQRVRLAGIQAPELERKEKFNTRGEPLAKEAQAFLNKLLANNDLEVGIEYDTTKLDAFNRTMAHLFLKDGTSVQQAMLKAGFAVARTTDNNLKYAQCYYQAEQTARTGQFQLWDFLAKNPAVHYPLVKSSEIKREDGGFKIIQGKIEKVTKSGTNYILNMDTTGVRVSKKNWDKFDYSALQKLEGQTIEARGQTYFYKGAMYMVIDHPYALDVFNPLNTKK